MFPVVVSFRTHGGTRAWLKIVSALLLALALGATGFALPLPGQSQQQTSQSQQQGQKPADQAPAEAGGPTGETGPIALPKKPEQPPEQPTTPRPRTTDKQPEYTMSVTVPVVTLDVAVLTKDGHFVPGLKKNMFKVYEDGVPQTVSNFSQSEAPITAVMLVEFASTNYYFIYDMLNAAYSFANSLRKDDWVALVAYDMKPEMIVDFTQDKRAIYAGLNQLRIPGFSETNLFDALYDTLDRLDGVEGRKYVILISSGIDTFSKLTLDKMLKKIQATRNVTIYSVGIGQALRMWMESHGMMSGIRDTTFLQADNQLSTFARMTGGRAYFPRFEAEMPEIFNDINANIRNEYTLAYHPTNTKLDGSYRKLKVELVDDKGQPLKMRNEKGKEVKYQIIAREGYTAKHEVD